MSRRVLRSGSGQKITPPHQHSSPFRWGVWTSGQQRCLHLVPSCNPAVVPSLSAGLFWLAPVPVSSPFSGSLSHCWINGPTVPECPPWTGISWYECEAAAAESHAAINRSQTLRGKKIESRLSFRLVPFNFIQTVPNSNSLWRRVHRNLRSAPSDVQKSAEQWAGRHGCSKTASYMRRMSMFTDRVLLLWINVT